MSISLPNNEILANFQKNLTGTFSDKVVINGKVCHKSIANCLLGLTVTESVQEAKLSLG